MATLHAWILAAGLGLGTLAQAADPVRGALLFAVPPAPGLLGCADCHSDNPVVNNFGNIWAGRNAVALIERAVQSNTGGMGYLREYRSSADFADIAAYLGNAPASAEFAPTPVGGRSAPATVRVSTSTKTGAGAFSARTEGDFQIVGNDCGSERPRFSVCSIDLVFAPTAAGDRRGALVLSHDATPTPVRLPLAGVAPDRPPAIARVEPATLDFGSAPAGLAGATRVALLSNDSTGSLTLSRITVEGGFGIVGGDCSAGTVLAQGQRCSVALRQEASAAAGARRGRLLFVHDGAGGGSQVGLAATARTEGAARIVVEPGGVDFGRVEGRGSATVRLFNAGSGDWRSIEPGALDSGFSAETAACQAALPLKPGQACTLGLAFQPTRAGRFSATLQLGGSGLEAPVELLLQGQGPHDGTQRPRWSVDVPRMFFDAVPGRPSTRQLRLRHDAAVALAPVWRIDGADAAEFAVEAAASDCGAQLAPGASCRLVLRFSPSATGARSARLRLGSAEGGPAVEPLDLPLAGRAASAQSPRIAVDGVAWSFASSSTAVQRIVVSNPGPVDWSWYRLQLNGEHAADFRLGGPCTERPTLPAGARCELEIGFQPTRPGPRAATVLLQPAGGEAALVTLGGADGRLSTRPVPFTGGLTVEPSLLAFQAGPGGAGAGRAQTLRWRNEGATALRIDGFELQGAGFELPAADGSSPADRCPTPPFALQPGAACTVAVRWPGGSTGAGGARVVARADDPWGGAAADLTISEDPAQRSNLGQGGGAIGAWGWWLALATAVAALALARRHEPPAR